MTDWVSWTVLGGLVCVAGLLAFLLADLPVARRRVARFAAREWLVLTGENCPQVIAYLAVTRRWRAAGVCAALTWYVVVGLRHDMIGVNTFSTLSGWFAGALVAEVRVRHRIARGHAASLAPRATSGYLPTLHRGLFTTTAVACLLLTGIAALTPGGLTPVTALPGVLAVGLTAAVVLVSRRIVLRPQPAAPADVLAADDAIRRRSLRVLTASATTLLLYGAVGEIAVLFARSGNPPTAPVALVVLTSLVAVPVVGWRLAVGRPAMSTAPVAATVS